MDGSQSGASAPTYYVDANGNYLGSFAPGATIPAGAVAVPTPPPSPIYFWNAGATPPAWQQIATVYYASATGAFLGGFGGGALPPAGAVQVPTPPPAHAANYTWNVAAAAWQLNAAGIVAAASTWYAGAIAAGCQIVSAAKPGTLNGTYALDSSSVAKLTAITAGINAGKGLPGGGATFNLIDLGGNVHAIGSADFLNLAVALENYVYACVVNEAAMAGGAPSAPPAQPVIIP